MSAPDISLLAKRRFGPMFAVQFLGAFNDNLLKFALLFLANFGIFAGQPDKAELLAAISTGLFILPYFLFSALAGQLADAIDKARLVRWVKAAEIGIMALVGAPVAFIRGPFVVEGAIQGGLGALAALGGLSLLGRALSQALGPLAAALGNDALRPLLWTDITGLLLGGALVGAAAGLLATWNWDPQGPLAR